MSFEFTVLSDDRFIEILEAWVDSPWPKTAEDGYALRDRFGWTPDYREPALFTSDVRPHESSSYFTARDGKIKSLKIPVTDIAPEEARGDSLEDALVIYRHFCDILKSRYGKPRSSPVEWCNRFVSFGVGYALSWSGGSSCWVGCGVSRDLVRMSRLR